MTITVTMRVTTHDRRMTALRASRVLEEHAWLVADELTGVLTYGAPGIREKPSVEVTQVVVRDGR
jgi:hypothetical protein